MATQTTEKSEPKTKTKIKTKTSSLEEKRKVRHTLRKAARKAESEKLKDPEFHKAFFAAKKARANARVAAFKKMKSGKK